LIVAIVVLSYVHSIRHIVMLWSPYGIGQTIIFSCCSLFFLLFCLA